MFFFPLEWDPKYGKLLSFFFFLSLLIMGSYPVFFLCNLLKKQDCLADN